MFKKIAIGLGVLIVAVAVGVYYLSQNAGKIVETVIETQGSRATQVDVALDAVNIDMLDLKAGLMGLTVANPAGFKTDRAISLGEVSVKIAKNWSADVIVIDEVMVNAPEVTYEIGASGSNIATIQQNVENFMKVMSGPDKAGSGTESTGNDAAGGQEGPKIIINNFYFKNGKVNVSASLMQGKTLTTPLPDIHLKDIGKDEGGASPAEVVQQLIAAITEKAGGAAGSLDLTQLGLADISGKAAEIGAAAKDAAKDAAEGALKGATENIGGAGDAVGEKLGGAVKNLFGN